METWMIEQIEQDEAEKEHQSELVLELPLYEEYPIIQEVIEPEEQRGVVVINIY